MLNDLVREVLILEVAASHGVLGSDQHVIISNLYFSDAGALSFKLFECGTLQPHQVSMLRFARVFIVQLNKLERLRLIQVECLHTVCCLLSCGRNGHPKARLISKISRCTHRRAANDSFGAIILL